MDYELCFVGTYSLIDHVSPIFLSKYSPSRCINARSPWPVLISRRSTTV